MRQMMKRFGWSFAATATMLLVGVGTVHAVRAGKTIVFSGKGSGEVIFRGQMHADKGVKCADCHQDGLPFKMKNGSSHITMKEMAAGKYCGKCHDGRQAFSVSDTSNCTRCHGGVAIPGNHGVATAATPMPASSKVVSAGPSPIPSVVVKSDIDVLPAARMKQRQNAYAIVVGIEKYRQNLPKADFATQDAKLVTEYLTKVMGYPEENVVTLTNDHAALGDFVKYFEKWLPNNVEAGSTLFVYYSGHGAPNPKTSDAYLVPYDGDPAFIDETGYSLKRMYAALGKLPAKSVVVALDSCFSGAGGHSVLAKGARPIVLSIENPVLLSKNMTVLSASAGDQISSTYDEKGHGLFTYFMLKGIKNEDVMKQDGSIDIGSLFEYIKPQVSNIARKKYNNEQTPQLVGAKKH